MSRILLADPLDESGRRLLEEAGVEVVELAEEDRNRLGELIGAFDAIVVRSRTRLTRELLEAGRPRLRVVGRAGIGVDNVDVPAATELGILVVNAPTANMISATEHTFALMLSLARNVPAADASVKAGDWDRKRFKGRELQGKTLGVVGLGRIGQNVAARARAFQMRVLAFDPYLDAAVAEGLGCELVELEDLLARADVVTLHTPLTPGTRDLIGAAQLGAMKPGALLVNCARGGVVEEDALLAALESGHLGGAALDVFAVEPPEDLSLAGHPRVVATPHIGAQTLEAQERVASDTVRMVLAALEDSLEVTAVNLPFVSTAKDGDTYLHLGEQLGRLASSILEGSLQSIRVELAGIAAELEAPITVAVVKGALTPFLQEAVNYVNAQQLAAGRGIKVGRTAYENGSDYAHLISVVVEGAEGRVELAGAVLGARDSRVVRFGGYPLEFHPAGRLLVLHNRDVPGVVGRLGTILGEAQINIADIHLARESGGKNAMAVLRLDEQPSPETLSALESLPEVDWIRVVDLGGES